jgi:hypothetical protein
MELCHLINHMDCQVGLNPTQVGTHFTTIVMIPLDFVALIKPPTRKQLPYSTYVKDANMDVHIQMFKKAIKANGEIINLDIINLFEFTLKVISLSGNFFILQNHPHYTFINLEQFFCK